MTVEQNMKKIITTPDTWERLLRRTNGRLKFRNIDLEFEKWAKKMNRPVPKYKIRFNCMFCLGKRADNQVCKSWGRKGNKIVPVMWAWICDDCEKELRDFNKRGRTIWHQEL